MFGCDNVDAICIFEIKVSDFALVTSASCLSGQLVNFPIRCPVLSNPLPIEWVYIINLLLTHTRARTHTHIFFYCKCTLVSIPYHINIYPNSKMEVKTKWSLNRECKWNCQTPISIQTSFYLAFSSLSMLYKLQLNCLSYFLEIFWGLLSVLQSCLFHSSHR